MQQSLTFNALLGDANVCTACKYYSLTQQVNSQKMKFLMLGTTAILLMSFSIDRPAYRIFDAKGKEVSYEKALKQVQDADMVFFGELHNNPISHWLQLQITQDLHKKSKENLLLGAEMFEADNQVIVEEYLSGLIAEARFEEECRLWKNYKTDYKPLMLFAKENNLPFVASNVPRRYANMVFKSGLPALDALSDAAKKTIAPLPIPTDLTVSCYAEMLEMGGGNDKFPMAQMIKDATMAHFILQYWKKGKQLLHFNGSFHSDKHEGIIWYIQQYYTEKLDIKTFTTVEQKDLENLDKSHFGKADFIIVVPEDMTKTH